LKNDKRDTRRIITTKGELPITRTVLRPLDAESLCKLVSIENVKCIAPLDIILKIDGLPFKMTREMMCEVAFWGQNQPSYMMASSILKKVKCVDVSHQTVRAVTEYVGKIIFEDDTKNANHLFDNQETRRRASAKSGVLYIQADGASVNTRTKNSEGSTWRENKLGMVFSSDDIKTRVTKKGDTSSKIIKKEYTSYVGSAREFKKYLYACAVRNGYGEYAETVILSDGAPWIKNIGIELFPNAVQILDLYHLCENTYAYAKAIFKSDEAKCKSWAEEIIDKLKKNEKHEVLKIVGKYRNRKLSKSVVNLYTYLENNFERIDYKTYIEKGYYIGSGAIESGNKVVLQKRMKLAGMRWGELSAQYLLSLRAKFESGLWDSSVVKRILTYEFPLAKNL